MMFDIAIRIATQLYSTNQLGAFSVECSTNGHGRCREAGRKCRCHEKYEQTLRHSQGSHMSQARASSIEEQFVNAVKSALDIQPDWSSGPLTVPSRTSKGDVETAEFADSSYMSRASYDLKACDLRITLRNGQLLRIAPIPIEYWDELLVAPSKGEFFLDFIRPRFNVQRLGWFKRVCGQFRSRHRMASGSGLRRFT